MIYENVELHNVAEVQPVNGGVRLQRVPENVRKELNENAQFQVMRPGNCEIRFISDSAESHITLSSEEETDVAIFHGNFDGSNQHTIGKEPVTISISQNDNIKHLGKQCLPDQSFSPNVRRVIFGGPCQSPVILHDVKGEGIRPPDPEDLPEIKYLAYGTSITHGFHSRGPHLNYAAQTAWHLNADLINLGVAGSCHCESAFADYIGSRTDWDIASLALSVNMQLFSLDEFGKRVEYMIKTVASADTSRPVACITLYPYFRDLGINNSDAQYGGTPDEYRQALRNAVAKAKLPNLHLIEGPDILTNIGGLTADLIHPSDNAMIEMGRNLSIKLKSLLNNQN